MPRGKKGKAKRKAERGGNILSPPEAVTVPPTVTADQYAATEEQIAALNLEREVMIDFLKSAGIPIVISTVPRPANVGTSMLSEDIDLQADIVEEEDSKEVDEFEEGKEVDEDEEEKEIDAEEKEVDEIEEEKEVDEIEEEKEVDEIEKEKEVDEIEEKKEVDEVEEEKEVDEFEEGKEVDEVEEEKEVDEIEEEKEVDEIEEEKEVDEIEEEKEVDEVKEKKEVDQIDEEPVIVDSVDSLGDESSELGTKTPSVGIFGILMNPPIEAMQGVIKKIMEFRFDLRNVRETNNVSIQCCAGQGDEPPARTKYQEARIRRVSHRIQHMRRSLGDDPHNAAQLGKLRKAYEEEVFKKVQVELRNKLAAAEVAYAERQKKEDVRD